MEPHSQGGGMTCLYLASGAPCVANGPLYANRGMLFRCQVPFFLLPALGGVGVFVAVYVLAKYYEVRDLICYSQ